MEYPSNSARTQPAAGAEPRRVEQVTQAEVNLKKPSLGQRFRQTFFSGDDAKTTVGYVFGNVILPQFKDLVVDAITQGVERRVYGESRGGRRPSSGGGVFGGVPGRINYGGMSNQARSSTNQRVMTPQARQQHDFGEIEVTSHAEAQNVLEGMYTLYGQYDSVTVADLYGLTGIVPTHVDRTWGWRDLRGASPRRTRSGTYMLDLPRPEYLGE